MSQHEGAQGHRAVRLPEVLARTGRSRSCLYEDMRQGRFPKPIKIGKRAVGWLEHDIERWFASSLAARDGQALEAA